MIAIQERESNIIPLVHDSTTKYDSVYKDLQSHDNTYSQILSCVETSVFKVFCTIIVFLKLFGAKHWLFFMFNYFLLFFGRGPRRSILKTFFREALSLFIYFCKTLKNIGGNSLDLDHREG